MWQRYVRTLVLAVVFVRVGMVAWVFAVFVFVFLFVVVPAAAYVVVIPPQLSVLHWSLLVASKLRHHDDLLRELLTTRIYHEYRDNQDIGLGLTGVLWCYSARTGHSPSSWSTSRACKIHA